MARDKSLAESDREDFRIDLDVQDNHDDNSERGGALQFVRQRASLITEAVYRLKNPVPLGRPYRPSFMPMPGSEAEAPAEAEAEAEAEADSNASIRAIAPESERPPATGPPAQDDSWSNPSWPHAPPSASQALLSEQTRRSMLPIRTPTRKAPARVIDYAKVDVLQGESAEAMLLRLSNEFQPIVEDGWDTVVYIGPPPQEHQQDDHEYEYIKQHFSKPYLMKSESLKATNSSRFAKLLGPMSARSERKLKKLGIHRLLPQESQAKYFIDLRPMQDEDEALLMITELTCTPGVLSWHLSHLASGVPKTLINGKDTLNTTSKPHTKSWIEADDSAPDDFGDKMDIQAPSSEDLSGEILGLEPEYNTIRHYMAIERLLHAIVGHDPKLNSAPKLWTYFAIAKFFDCATNSKITSWIFDWLFTGNNSNFIQANPEVSYRMALGMQSPDILRTTFAMLVGERALMQAGTDHSGSTGPRPGANQVSAHGRSTSTLDDDELNRIDHAAHSLTRRMTTLFDKLANPPMKWTLHSPQMTKLDLLRQVCLQKGVVDEPYSLLLEYIRGEVYQALSQNVEEGDLMRLYRSKGYKEFGWLRRSRAFADAYNSMPLPQRLLTQSFWSQLENYGLYQESEKLVAWTRGHSLDGLDELAPDFNGEIDCVTKAALCQSIMQMNLALTDRSIISNQLPDELIYNRSVWEARLLKDDPDFISDTECADQELVRALQGLDMIQEIAVSGHGGRPYNGSAFDEAYPYGSIARKHREKGLMRNVSIAILLSQLSMEMRAMIMREVLTPGYVNDAMGIESEISISQMDILLCLNDDEWKYLPLWAGGLDDGSGGVFAELDVPDMDQVEGFRGGKMGLGKIPGAESSLSGSTAGASEDFDEVMTDEGVSTVGKASRLATDGTTSAGGSTVISLDD